MSKEEFFERIRSNSPEALASSFFNADAIHLFADQTSYVQFRARISQVIASTEFVAVVGSGNWRYSLNPEKGFREFGSHSDVDVAIISPVHFQNLWEEMRVNHRAYFYKLDANKRMGLRRSGENIYAGFVSPTWIPNRTPARAFEYRKLLNFLSDESVKFLPVKMMFFKNTDEAVDYYKRGFMIARRALR